MSVAEQLIIERLTELFDQVQIDDLQFVIESIDLIEASAIDRCHNQTTVVKLEIRESNQSIYIPNLFLPPAMRGLGIAMRMLWIIHIIGQSLGYRVYLTLVTETTKLHMLQRGAKLTGEADVLEIVKGTNLYSKDDQNNNLYLRVRL
jgi:hypothetical protein